MATTSSPSAPQKPGLLDRVGEAIRARRYSRNTEDAYVAWINRVQPPAAYPSEAQRPPGDAGSFAVRGIPSEPVARRTEIGCSILQP
jgi:hypothetical protein